jgi:iron complex transport system substrate-binding protein
MNIHKQSIIFVVVTTVLVLAVCAGCTGTSEKSNAGMTVAASNPEPTQAFTTASIDSGSSSIPITITQSDGKQAMLPCRPERIIVTNTDAAEMLIALGAADTIVGVVESTKNVSYVMDRIPQAVSIGDWQTPNIERMLFLKPDVVISYASSRPKNLDQINAANISIIYLDCYRLPKLASDARAVGVLTGHEQNAEEYARMVENTTSTVMQRVTTVPAAQIPTVYFEGYSDFTAAGTGSGSDDMLMMAGGKNIAAGLSSSSPKVSAEWVVAQNPAFIMKVMSAKETRPFSQIVQVMKTRTGWNTMTAVQQDRIYLFANSVEYGPKSYIGLAYTAKILHPELFRDYHPLQMLDDYAGKYVAGTNVSVPVYPEPA